MTVPDGKIIICHLITKLELGGAQRNTLYTVSHLDKSKFRVILIAGKGGILDEEARSLKDVEVIFAPHLIRKISPLNDFLSFLFLYKKFKELKPDLVHTHSSKAGIIGRIAAYLAEVPLIVHTFHGFGFHDFQNKLKKWLYVFLEKAAAPVSSKLITVSSDNIKKAVTNRIGRQNQYMVIRSGIDIARYRNLKVSRENKLAELGIEQNIKIISTIGPFKPQKNFKDLITTARHLKMKRDNFVMLIIGDGEQRQELEGLIGKLNLNSNVKLLGWRHDTDEILAISDIFVMSSLWEGLPRSCLEAMAIGLPVVVNAVDGLKEIIKDGENGFLTEPFNTPEMAAKILTLIDNEKLSQNIGKNARESITNEFDINFMVQQQEDLYTELFMHAR